MEIKKTKKSGERIKFDIRNLPLISTGRKKYWEFIVDDHTRYK